MRELPARDPRPRRSSYEPDSAPETFVVPLLKRHIESIVAAHAPKLGPGSKALDVGCGQKPFEMLLSSFGLKYTSLDVQQSSDGGVDFIAAIDSQVPEGLLAAGPFQFILCTEVLEHVADWQKAFQNLSQLLAPGGVLLITCPFFYHLHEEPYDFWRPTLHALRDFARRYQLQVVSAEAAGDAWDVLGTLLASCMAVAHKRTLRYRIQARLFEIARRVAFAALRTRWPQRLAGLRGPVYTHNVVVLEKA